MQRPALLTTRTTSCTSTWCWGPDLATSWTELQPAFYCVAAVAILLTGISKGGLGTGGAGLAVPLMSLYVAPADAAGMVLPILCAMDLFGVHAYRGRWSKGHLGALIPGALVGIGVGALVFGLLPASSVRLLLGIVAVLFALNRWFGASERLASALGRAGRVPGRVAGAFWGGLSGFTSTLAHAGGPPFAVYMLAQRLDKTVLVATSAVFFLVVNYVKLVPYYVLGQLNPTNLTFALLYSPLAPLGIWLGVWLHRRLSETLFYQVSYTLLFATGVKLVYDALVH